jgi:hypothetical protein
MKYLKRFENNEYDVGDYVKLKYIPIDVSYYGLVENVTENLIVQIIHIHKNKYLNYMFKVLKTNQEFSCSPAYIDRKLTKEEIEKIKIEQNIYNYNL